MKWYRFGSGRKRIEEMEATAPCDAAVALRRGPPEAEVANITEGTVVVAVAPGQT